MKTIHTRSLLLGALGTVLFISLTGSRQAEAGEKLELVASPSGLGIYNRASNTLYMYKMWNGNLKTAPTEAFKITGDGAALTEIKLK